MQIQRAQTKDAADILALQKEAYQSEAALYNDYSIPPLHQTLEEMTQEIIEQTVLKAVDSDRIVGSVRAVADGNNCSIGRLIVHPDVQNQGIGTRLMHEIMACFGQTHRFELFTGVKSEKNIRLYQKLGFDIYRHQTVSETLELVFMEKHV
ncbi:MAG: GNAT family N-acetyltransferase [Desulfobacteraceae bacterium]|nr:MAG: GNAT family N-acetyltransferase [Desulfobacteraceae bacterium]